MKNVQEYKDIIKIKEKIIIGDPFNAGDEIVLYSLLGQWRLTYGVADGVIAYVELKHKDYEIDEFEQDDIHTISGTISISERHNTGNKSWISECKAASKDGLALVTGGLAFKAGTGKEDYWHPIKTFYKGRNLVGLEILLTDEYANKI